MMDPVIDLRSLTGKSRGLFLQKTKQNKTNYHRCLADPLIRFRLETWSMFAAKRMYFYIQPYHVCVEAT